MEISHNKQILLCWNGKAKNDALWETKTACKKRCRSFLAFPDLQERAPNKENPLQRSDELHRKGKTLTEGMGAFYGVLPPLFAC